MVFSFGWRSLSLTLDGKNPKAELLVDMIGDNNVNGIKKLFTNIDDSEIIFIFSYVNIYYKYTILHYCHIRLIFTSRRIYIIIHVEVTK